MVNWYSHLTKDLIKVVHGDPFWETYLNKLIISPSATFNLHLAVMVEPFLSFMLDGTKTIESRFSINRCAPYDCVEKGDVLLLKKSGGPIVGLCQVTECWFYRLDPQSWTTIKNEFATYICAQDPEFWRQRESASFATLIRVRNVRSITPIKVKKRDRRGWVVIPPLQTDPQLPLWDNQI